jgi:hypothetical protein
MGMSSLALALFPLLMVSPHRPSAMLPATHPYKGPPGPPPTHASRDAMDVMAYTPGDIGNMSASHVSPPVAQDELVDLLMCNAYIYIGPQPH